MSQSQPEGGVGAGRSRLGALVVGGVVALAGVAWLLSRPSTDGQGPPQPARNEFSGPVALSASPETVDLGDLVPGRATSGTVRLRNVTDREIRIASALASCGCTAVDWPREPIAPGAEVEATVSMTPGDSQGEVLAKTVAFMVKGSSPAVVSVRGKVGTFLTCEPRMLDAPPEREGEPKGALVRLVATDGIPFRVVGIEPALATPGPSQPAVEQVVEVDWTRWRSADRPEFFQITTDHPKAPTFTVTLRRAVRAPEPP